MSIDSDRTDTAGHDARTSTARIAALEASSFAAWRWALGAGPPRFHNPMKPEKDGWWKTMFRLTYPVVFQGPYGLNRAGTVEFGSLGR